MGSIGTTTLRRITSMLQLRKFIDAIKKDAGGICTNYVTPEEMLKQTLEVKPFLDQTNHGRLEKSSLSTIYH